MYAREGDLHDKFIWVCPERNLRHSLFTLELYKYFDGGSGMLARIMSHAWRLFTEDYTYRDDVNPAKDVPSYKCTAEVECWIMQQTDISIHNKVGCVNTNKQFIIIVFGHFSFIPSNTLQYASEQIRVWKFRSNNAFSNRTLECPCTLDSNAIENFSQFNTEFVCSPFQSFSFKPFELFDNCWHPRSLWCIKSRNLSNKAIFIASQYSIKDGAKSVAFLPSNSFAYHCIKIAWGSKYICARVCPLGF